MLKKQNELLNQVFLDTSMNFEKLHLFLILFFFLLNFFTDGHFKTQIMMIYRDMTTKVIITFKEAKIQQIHPF